MYHLLHENGERSPTPEPKLGMRPGNQCAESLAQISIGKGPGPKCVNHVTGIHPGKMVGPVGLEPTTNRL